MAKRALRLACVALSILILRHHSEFQAFTGSVRAQTGSRISLRSVAETGLSQLAAVTTLSIDTGDLAIIKEYAETGLITDATTNPLFVSQAGLSGDPVYVAFVEDAIEYACGKVEGVDERVALAMDKLAVNLGVAISKLVTGYISTEVDPRLSFDKEETLRRARRIIALYEEAGVPRERVLIKLAATWEGIAAMAELEKEGITCNMTLVFGFVQAVAAAQYGARLISPFPGRVLDWHKRSSGKETWSPREDPGVVAVERIRHIGSV
ncbi:Transaldolase [Symbiodinium microadriaticum]|uniref:Transaldolase n=1 Tax=Symbiodinium microadriaticum TaxID=2951 RepID=A0A1Q9CZ61_SYMMI|nr:Transaldolase [Symbiodinium microadriaticum]